MSFEPIDQKKPTRKGRKGTNPKASEEAKVKGLRAGMMAIDKALGMSIKDIAEQYRISPSNVKEYLSLAEEEGFVEHYRKMMYDRLGAKVLAVYDAHLDQGNLQAARDIATGLGIFQTAKPQVKEKAITTLAEWREEKDKDKDAGVN
jgi:DNA-binding Lrp family transcriptional regulator